MKNQKIINKQKQADPSEIEIAKKLINIHQSAMDRKLEFNLTFESVRALLKFPTCYYTGKKFESEGQYARSIDRIDSAKGYIEGNVVSCTIDINGKKSNLSDDEIEILYTKIVLPKKKSESVFRVSNIPQVTLQTQEKRKSNPEREELPDFIV